MTFLARAVNVISQCGTARARMVEVLGLSDEQTQHLLTFSVFLSPFELTSGLRNSWTEMDFSSGKNMSLKIIKVIMQIL